MAMTGGTAKLVKTGYKGGNTAYPIKLYVYYKTSQDVTNNRSTITLGMYFTQNSGSVGAWAKSSNSYLGTTSNTFDGSFPKTSAKTYWIKENVTMTVNHNADGTGKATIYWKWGVNSSWAKIQNPSGSFSIDLPTINRTFTATFGANGGLAPSASSKTFTGGAAIGTLPTIQRIGYTFLG